MFVSPWDSEWVSKCVRRQYVWESGNVSKGVGIDRLRYV